jgi:hypothetical protein
MSEQPKYPSESPNRDQLAGVNICIETEERLFIGSFEPTPSPLAETVRPTTAELAGVYVCVEAKEKTIYPDLGLRSEASP